MGETTENQNDPESGDSRLRDVYEVKGADAAAAFYDDWAEGYEAEVSANGYATPKRCAETLAAHAALPWAPIMDLGCGTGLSGLALKAAGFECIDGFDISPQMLSKARDKGVYRDLTIADLSQPLAVEEGIYQNAAAIGAISPDYMPATVLDDILGKLPSGGCLVFSVNDKSAADGSIVGRINDLIDSGYVELLFAEHGEHLPGIDLRSTVYLLRRR
ncbi:MAG: class I SAM-dependent DNA methyltransferase [Pikeienuella sp.]